MCGRFIQAQQIELLEKRFNIEIPENIFYKPAYNISPGNNALVITNKEPHLGQMFRFGLVPFWAKKDMYLINARAEGDNNKQNNPAEYIKRGIVKKPAFRKPIRSQRCLVIADCFVEGTTAEKLSKPFLVYLTNHVRPFAFAGLWDEWNNPDTGEIIKSFAIITTTANSLMQKIPHHRSPVILNRKDETTWLSNNTPLNKALDLLKPFDGDKMNAYPVSNAIKNSKYKDKKAITPIGERLQPEYKTIAKNTLELKGMGANKKPDR